MRDLFDTDKGALFSPCRRYRYTLWRIWDDERPMCMFIGLNPSTADETVDDPTIRRCINFATRWGFGGLYMTNLFGFRATDPEVMKAEPEPVGPHNDRGLLDVAAKSKRIICAWGVHGVHNNRDRQVRALLGMGRLQHLGLTKEGHPRHPLYLKKDTEPQKYILERDYQPFYCGSQMADFLSQCSSCQKGYHENREQWRCPIELAICEGYMDDGKITTDVAFRMGLNVETPDYWDHSTPCTEYLKK